MARRTRTPEPDRPRRPSHLVAAAAPVDISSKVQVKLLKDRHQGWQDEAWAAFDAVGEIGHTLEYRANVISKVRMFAAYKAEPDAAPIPVAAAFGEGLIPQSVAEMAEATIAAVGEGQGTAAMLHKQSLCLDVPGECHMVAEDIDGVETWRTYSDAELTEKSGKAWVFGPDPGDNPKGRALNPASLVFRLWNPHPRRSIYARSALQPLVLEGLPEEILLISKELRSGSKSRASKGILGVAQEVALSRSVNSDGNRPELDQADGGSTFQAELIEMMTAPLANDGSASEVVPWVVEVPANLIETWAKHISLGQAIDPAILERARYVIERIANGINMPKEITLGMGSVNHWGSFQIERSGFKAYIEPSVLSIAHGWTTGFYLPRLKASQVDANLLAKLCVWYDETEAITPQDRVEQASQGVGLQALSRAVWRREAGYDEEDAPTDEELVKFIGLDRGILTAELTSVLMALAQLIPQSAVIVKQPAPAAPSEPTVPADREANPQEPPPNDQPVTAAGTAVSDVGERLAAIDRRLFTQVATAAEMALERAVERAGNRLRTLAQRDRNASALLTNVEAAAVARTLGRPLAVRLAAQEGQDDDETLAALVSGSFTALTDRVARLLERAQQATVGEALAVAAPTDRLSDAELAQLASTQADDREAATLTLTATLTALALAVLFDGPPDAGPGEIDLGAVVPANLIREALAVAGGAATLERSAAGGLAVDGRPVGGVATGERARTLFARVRAWWTGYRWEYGDAAERSRPFPPHQALAGRTFATWDSPELAADGVSWLGALSWSPGDHRGCRCSFVPVVLADEARRTA